MKKVILATVIWLVPLLGYGSETSHVARLEILFPETREGVTVADLPRATPEWRQDNRDSLRSAFLRSNHGVLVEDEGCSFITRALYDQDDLYIGDITADGIEDILYVGSALCREGDATVIWYGSESRQGRWMVARDAPRILTSRVLRIHTGSRPGLAGMKPGCCDHPTTQYYSYFLGKNNRVDVDKQMAYPETVLPERSSVILRRELVLRSSPQVLDEYNKDKSQRVAHAVFGNILRKYLSGATAESLARTEDEDGTPWTFVRIDRSNWHLSHHTAVKTDVGWTDSVRLPGCSSQPPWVARESLSSPSDTRTVTHYMMKRDVGPGIWRNMESCLRVTESDAAWWVPRIQDTAFILDEFVDDSRLFVTVRSAGGSGTYLLDLDSRDLKSLGGSGRATYVREGPNEGLVLLRGQRHYSLEGPYYVDALRTPDGELVELISSEGTGRCLKIADILHESESTAKLRQSLDECVVVYED